MRRLGSGRIIRVGGDKVPRIIGREASMINIIKEKLDAELLLAKMALSGFKAKHRMKWVAVEAIEFINKHSHQEGLTDTVSKFLDDRMKGIPLPPKDSLKDEDVHQRREGWL